MSDKKNRLEPKLPRGFADRGPADIRAVERMMETIKRVYERYGFEPVETPFIEYTEALGKFLPDQDRPNEGVFSFQDEGGQEARSAEGATGKQGEWLSLRYDLTAPLARYVAENYERLPKPYRSYRAGWVFRNEKPGPGRYRQFMQFDADTVGAASPAADAEICMMAADVMEELFGRGQYVIKVNNRKVLDGVMEAIGLGGEENAGKRLTVLRAIDKMDRLGIEGVRLLLGEGRWDGGKEGEGDFTKGAGLNAEQTEFVTNVVLFERFIEASTDEEMDRYNEWDRKARSIEAYDVGFKELDSIRDLVSAAGYSDRIEIDPSVVRGLEYYTGPVFEAQLLFEIPNEKGQPVVFGSVGGGGRYDGLVGRFKGQDVPATGFSVGVSRLAAALKAVGKLGDGLDSGPVVVTVMDRDRLADYQAMVAELRNAGIAAEMYLGNPKKFGPQLKYADMRNSPCAIIAGSNEFDAGMLQVKDLIVGKAQAAKIGEDHAAWKEERPGQFEISRGELVAKVKELLEKQRGE